MCRGKIWDRTGESKKRRNKNTDRGEKKDEKGDYKDSGRALGIHGGK